MKHFIPRFIYTLTIIWTAFFALVTLDQASVMSSGYIEVITQVENFESAMALAQTHEMTLTSYSHHGLVTYLVDAHRAEGFIEMGFALNQISEVARPWILPPKTTEDPFLKDQYALTMMDVHQAWTQTLGSATVLIAVIDTGIDTAHEEFSGRLSSLSYNSRTKQVGLSQVLDDNGHGTMVTGVIAANKDNSKGIAGIVQNSQIMVIKANRIDNLDTTEDESKSFDDASIIEAIYYAVNNGADVINMSLGGSYANPLTKEAIDYAKSQGVIVVAASGNDGVEHKFYPASFEGVISVGAVDQTKTIWNKSNYNDAIDVTAPGVNIVTTFNGNAYGSATGTSLAAPQVTGVVALMLAHFTEYSDEMIIMQLKGSAMDQGAPGYDIYYGHGIINASDALSVDYVTVSFETFGGTLMPTIEVVKGVPFIVEAPEKTGYLFEGWYLDNVFANAFIMGEDVLQENTTLYAKFSIETYEIVFITTGASISTMYVTYEDIVVLPDSQKAGYHFVGWYLDENFETPFTSNRVDRDITLYARFEIILYTVTFYQGNTVDFVLNVEHGQTFDLYEPDSEYPFVGWFTDQGLQIAYEIAPVTSDMSLYAKFDDGTYTVVFYSYDLTTVISIQQVFYGTSISQPEPPEKPDSTSFTYTFTTWSADTSHIDQDLNVYPLYDKTYLKGSIQLAKGLDTVFDFDAWMDGGLVILDSSLTYEIRINELSTNLYEITYDIIYQQEIIDQKVRYVSIVSNNPIRASLKPDVTTIEQDKTYIDPGVSYNVGLLEVTGSVDTNTPGTYILTYLITYQDFEVTLVKYVYVLPRIELYTTRQLALPPRKEVWMI